MWGEDKGVEKERKEKERLQKRERGRKRQKEKERGTKKATKVQPGALIFFFKKYDTCTIQ